MNDEQLEALWDDFGDIPINNDDEINAEFITDGIIWSIGTDRFDIWHWFDKVHSKGVAWLSGCVEK